MSLPIEEKGVLCWNIGTMANVLSLFSVITKADDLSERRKQRQCEWDQFEQDVKDKLARMDQAFEEKERELIDHYRRIREKLQPPHKSE